MFILFFFFWSILVGFLWSLGGYFFVFLTFLIGQNDFVLDVFGSTLKRPSGFLVDVFLVS